MIVTVDADASLIPALRAHAEAGLARFPTFPGYLGGALHVSADGTRLVQHLRWRTEREYQACVDDPCWDDLPSTRHFLEAARSGEARVDARIFTVVATSPGSPRLRELLASMDPIFEPDEFVFVTVPDGAHGDHAVLGPIASFRESEGLTLVLPRHRADEAGLAYEGAFRMITLTVQSALSDVGLTAAVAASLTRHGISANVIAAFFHDHVFVPADRAEEALRVLQAVAADHIGDRG